MTERGITDRNLALEAVRVTEASALAAARLMGRGDEEAADRAAVEAMFEALQILSVDGTVRVGERNTVGNARLAVGTKVGNGSGPKVDVALLPLEGPTIIARGEPNGISVIAMTQEGGFLYVPEVYMEKIAVGRDLPDDVVDLDAEPATNLKELAKAKKVAVSDLVVCTLDRPRHKEIIAKIREAGAHIMLMADGDVSGIIAASQPESVVDMYLGTGNAAQGVLAAAALACIGGQMQARLVLRSDDDKALAAGAGIKDPSRRYAVREMASGDVTFAATGVTTGPMLAGVRRRGTWAITQSLVMRSKTGTLRYIEAHHNVGRPAVVRKVNG